MSKQIRKITADIPEKLGFLFEPCRYKVLYGGRGGSKSWGIARALLIKGTEAPLRILCARETMQSISDSVHKLLCDQIALLELDDHYTIQKSSIIGRNGTEFAFVGLRHNVSQIKSYESFDIAWVEEAQAVSRASWEVLIPTIRKPGSEIWVSFNPVLAEDDTYRRFVTSPPPDAKVVKIGWRDNPWFGQSEMVKEKDYLKESDPDAYEHVWEGSCVLVVEGAIYANEFKAVDREGRITRVPYTAEKPVSTFWDLGYGDSTSIWFVQAFPFEYRVIDFLEGERYPLKHYMRELQAREYVYAGHFLPHDARAHELGTGRSIEEQLRAAGFRVQIVPDLSVADGLNAARTIFPRVWFDGERCADGIQALRHYRWAPRGALGQVAREPLHDWSSHAADAFRYFALGIKQPKPKNLPALGRPAPPRRVSQWS